MTFRKMTIALASAIVVMLLLSGCSTSNDIKSVPSGNLENNYHDSIYYFPMDIHKNVVAVRSGFFGYGLKLYENGKRVAYFKDFPLEFQLYNDCIIYLDERTLKKLDYKSNSSEVLASDVWHFRVDGDTIYYVKGRDHTDIYRHTDLYSLKNGVALRLFSDVESFCLGKDMIFILDEDDHLWKTEKNKIAPVEFCSGPLFRSPDSIISAGKYLVLLYGSTTRIGFVDIDSGRIKDVILSDRVGPVHISGATDGKNLFVSTQAYMLVPISPRSAKDSADGLHVINLETLSHRKVSDLAEIYQIRLYGDYLYCSMISYLPSEHIERIPISQLLAE